MSETEPMRDRCREWAGNLEVSEEDILLKTTIPGAIDAVGGVVDQIVEKIRNEACIKGHEFEVEVALLEAIGNAVEHGCQGDCSKEVAVCVACTAECGLLVVIRDPGEGFDPGSIPSPLERENLMKTHGRGVWLINQLMDGVHYAEGGAEIRMHKRPGAKEEK